LSANGERVWSHAGLRTRKELLAQLEKALAK
jgi:hypothetical protein